MIKIKTDFKKAIGKELQWLRLNNNMSAKELQDKSGIASTTILRYEKGINIQLNKLQVIVENYNMDLSIFFKKVIAKMELENIE